METYTRRPAIVIVSAIDTAPDIPYTFATVKPVITAIAAVASVAEVSEFVVVIVRGVVIANANVNVTPNASVIGIAAAATDTAAGDRLGATS